MSAMQDPESRPRVTLPQGTVVGVTQTGAYPNPVDAFLGIPYAQPPTGDRRFRPPVKVEKAAPEKIIDASQFGPRAPAKQFLIIGPKLAESEDCLTANVFRQQAAAAGTSDSKLLPVALYMHGGAFNRGSASMHDTASMVGWSAAPFVAVSFGYRIGALGFLPSGLSAREGALNLGLKDQILMMEWVQENIHLFGGDKDNVTLIGLSAGAHSIGHHLLNYEEGKPPLFHRAVMESGAPTSRAVRHPDAEIHEQQFADFLDAVKCPKGTPESEVFPYLRSLPIDVIAAAQTKVFYEYNPSLRWAFQPVIDGEIIRQRPIDAWRRGEWHKMPLMTGFNGNEGSLYVSKQMDSSEEFTAFWKTLLPQLSDEDVSKINELYPDPTTDPTSIYRVAGPLAEKGGVGQMYKRIEAAYAHYAYVAPARQTAHLAAASHKDAPPVYLYHWALEKTLVNGAAHGENMLYEVRDPATCRVSPAQDELARVLHAYVTSFICTGDPNGVVGVERPRWEAHSRDDGGKKVKMIFGKDNKEFVGAGSGVDGDLPSPPPAELVEDVRAKTESDFWWDKVEISQQ
ncbi:acetylcholinesterase precursor [Apiospora marii]|uniref:Carboxylic ester hydrolase n=1 Tax=Apiospora marii TaxID=335849 RepID=A0ABR1SSK5_9PEZI